MTVKTRLFSAAALLLMSAAPLFADEGPAVGELVKFEGKIVKVNPPQREIYVFANGQKNEYYFTDQTMVIENGQSAPFSKLIEGQKVRVSAKKIGKRLDPVQVEILGE